LLLLLLLLLLLQSILLLFGSSQTIGNEIPNRIGRQIGEFHLDNVRAMLRLQLLLL